MSQTDFYLLISSFLLGFRHGIDWDHIAAILDLTGSGSIEYDGSVAARRFHWRSVRLATWYALGHALIVVSLGLLIRSFARLLPPWFDTVMERVVGATLVVFGVWIVLAIAYALLFEKKAAVTSRSALIAALLDRLVAVFRPNSRSDNEAPQAVPLGSRGLPAFIIGVIHGAGAETSTQVILIAAVAAASNLAIVGGLLACFTLGLICCNALIALAASAGFLSLSSVRPLYLGLGVVASAFSVWVGAQLLFGLHGLPAIADWLPKAQTEAAL